MRSAILCSFAVALSSALPACIQDFSAPNRLGIERPALLPVTQKERDSADKRALEKPQRELPAGGAGKEFPGQSNAGPAFNQVVTLDVPATASQPAAIADYDIDDNKDQAIPGHDIVVPGTTSVIDKTWGQVYPLPDYPHRDWAPTVTHYQTGGVPGNPWYFNNIWGRPDYQPTHPYGAWGSIGADWAEVPYFFVQLVELPVLVALDNPFNQRTRNFPSLDPNYRLYLPQGNIVPSPYEGTLHYEEPSTRPMSTSEPDDHPISRELPPVPVRP